MSEWVTVGDCEWVGDCGWYWGRSAPREGHSTPLHSNECYVCMYLQLRLYVFRVMSIEFDAEDGVFPKQDIIANEFRKNAKSKEGRKEGRKQRKSPKKVQRKGRKEGR